MCRTRSVIVLLCVLMLITPGCRKPTIGKHGVVRAAYVPAGYYLPFLIVEKDGLLEKRGYALELKRFNDNAEMISNFLNGNLDVTAQSALTMFPVEQRHPGMFKFIYGQYLNSYYFVVPADSKYQDLKALKGSKEPIGIWKSPTAAAFVELILATHDLKETEDYTIQRYDAGNLTAQLENKTINVLFGFDVPIAKLVESGQFRYLEPDAARNLLPGQPIFNGGGFVPSKLIAEDPDKARAIRDALLEAIETIRTNRSHAIEVLSEKLGFTQAITEKAHIDEFAWPNDQLIDSATATEQLLRRAGGVLEDQPLDVTRIFWLKEK